MIHFFFHQIGEYNIAETIDMEDITSMLVEERIYFLAKNQKTIVVSNVHFFHNSFARECQAASI